MFDSADTLDIILPECVGSFVVVSIPDAFVRVARERLSGIDSPYDSGCARWVVWRFPAVHASDAIRLVNGVFGAGYAYDVDHTRLLPSPLGTCLATLPVSGIGESLTARLDVLRERAEARILLTRTEISRLRHDAVTTLRDMTYVEYILDRLIGRTDATLVELLRSRTDGVSGTAHDASGLFIESLTIRHAELTAERDRFHLRCSAFIDILSRIFPDGFLCSR